MAAERIPQLPKEVIALHATQWQCKAWQYMATHGNAWQFMVERGHMNDMRDMSDIFDISNRQTTPNANRTKEANHRDYYFFEYY
jgi:hypothetical protein